MYLKLSGIFSLVHCFEDCYVGKQPQICKEYCEVLEICHHGITDAYLKTCTFNQIIDNNKTYFLCGQKQEGHDDPVSLHWLICEIHSYQTLHYLGIGLKHKTPYKD